MVSEGLKLLIVVLACFERCVSSRKTKVYALLHRFQMLRHNPKFANVVFERQQFIRVLTPRILNIFSLVIH